MTVFLSLDRLQLLPVLLAALTGTWWGLTLAGLLLGVLLVGRVRRGRRESGCARRGTTRSAARIRRTAWLSTTPSPR